MAVITIDNAGFILSRLFNAIDSGHFSDRDRLLATELEELPLMSTEFLTSVIDNMNNGNTTVNVCDSGRYTIDNISGFDMSIVDMDCELLLTFLYVDNYRPRYFWSPDVSVIINSNSTNHVEASMDFNYLRYIQAYAGGAEENIDLALTGSISYSNTVLNITREIYTGLNLVGEYDIGKDYVVGKMIKFSDFGINELIDDVNDPENRGAIYFSGSPAIFYHSDVGGVIVETISPLRFSGLHNSTANNFPDESGEILFTGNNSSMTFKVMSERHFKLEVDSDGDSNPDAIRYIYYGDFREDYVSKSSCYYTSYGTPTFSCAYYNLSDYDGDGMHDIWETLYNTSPGTYDAEDDDDNDGLTNYEEYMQGYYPWSEFSPGIN